MNYLKLTLASYLFHTEELSLSECVFFFSSSRKDNTAFFILEKKKHNYIEGRTWVGGL